MTLLFITLHLMATRNEVLRRRLRRRAILAAEAGDSRDTPRPLQPQEA